MSGRPLTDNQIEFEDLILFAINYGDVSKAGDGPEPAERNLLTVYVPESPVDGHLEVSLWLEADGILKGASIPLVWNADVVRPVSFAAGELATAQAGQTLVLSPALGTVDVGHLGAPDDGLSGTGLLATVTFEVLGAGDAGIAIGEIRARNAGNEAMEIKSTVAFGAPERIDIPDVSLLYNNYPNPFNPTNDTRVRRRPGRAGLVERL